MTLQEILYKLGIDDLNAMQQDMMQACRKSDNLVLLSPTGSGKTLAYLLPLLGTIRSDEAQVQAMIIVPSRELAMQTASVIKQSGTASRAVAVYGGRPAMEEHRVMRGVEPHIIVGTPGRLLDHLTKGNIDASHIHTLVIDEFDKCLELGFREEMRQVLAHLTNVKKRVLLSATDNPEISRFLPEYTRLDYIDQEPVSERIGQFVVKSPLKDKLETLRDLLLTRGQESTLVFVGFRESVERVHAYLRTQGFYASALHGGMEQKDREGAVFRFVAGSTNILVSTDLASRGLDIPALDNVVHYHLPLNEQAFVHRNGRTARWDREGRSYLIVGPEEVIPSYVGQYQTISLPPASQQQAAEPVFETLYIGKGKRDKLSRGDIAGFLMKVGGLDKDSVGLIDVHEHHSYAAVSRKRVSETLVRLRGQKIKGLKTIIERMR